VDDAALGTHRFGLAAAAGLTIETLLERACKRLDDDMRYHSSLFADAASAKTLSEIDAFGLPHDLHRLGGELLTNCDGLLPLVVSALQAMLATCEQQRLKALRTASALKVKEALARVRALARAYAGRKGTALPAEVSSVLEEVVETLAPMVADAEAPYSDDDDYL